MSSPALTLVSNTTVAAPSQRGTVARKAARGTAGTAADAKAAAEALVVSREEERLFVLAAQEGDTSAFAQLVRRHQQRAYAVARAVLLSHEDAEDAVQEGFLHAHRALSRFRPDQPFGAWLHRIISNAALDLARRRKVRDTDELVDTHASPFRDPAEADELQDRLRSALAQLPDRQRSVLVLHDVEGYKHAEIGAMLGIPEGTARSDLHHARAAMRTILGSLRRPA
jgi:RNA polymerase sigma-70 factor, ECF subfamily